MDKSKTPTPLQHVPKAAHERGFFSYRKASSVYPLDGLEPYMIIAAASREAGHNKRLTLQLLIRAVKIYRKIIEQSEEQQHA